MPFQLQSRKNSIQSCMDYLVSNLPHVGKHLGIEFAHDIVTKEYFCIKVNATSIEEAVTVALETLAEHADEVSLNDVMFVYDQASIEDNNPFCVETKLILSNAGLHNQANDF